ncbi:MAG: hypothetical protein ACOC3Z_01360 [Nanoarchaeota archaeon]
MAKKDKSKDKQEKLEKEYIIPLRSKFQKAVRYKKTPRAVKAVKEFLVQHMKIRDRDLNKIKLDIYLNEFLWRRGIKNPIHKVKVKAVKEINKDGEEIVNAYLVDYPKNLEFKKKRLEKLEKESEEIGKKKKAQKKATEEEAKDSEQAQASSSSETESKQNQEESTEKTKHKDKKESETESEKQVESKEKNEKQEAGIEKMQQRAKQSAKAMKHQTGGKTKEKTQPKRQVMNK